MANDMVSGISPAGEPSVTSGRPPWVVPVVLLVIVGVVIQGGRMNKDVVENPLVDFAVLTTGVFAFAAVFRFLAVKADTPGLARFFGGK